MLDILRYDGISLWWFANTHAHTLFPAAKEAILAIEQTERVLEEESPDHVVVLGFGSMGEIIRQVCDRNQVRCDLQASGPRLCAQRFKDQIKMTAVPLLIGLKEHRRRHLATSASGDSRRRAPIALFLSPSMNWRTVWSYERGRQDRVDVFMGRMMEETHRLGYDIVCVDVDYSLTGNIDILRDRCEKKEWRCVPFEYYYNRNALTRLSSNPRFSELGKAFRTVRNSDAFRESLQYHSIHLWSFLERRFKAVLSEVQNGAKLIEGAREMIRLEKPNAIAMTYETGAYAKATIVAAEEAGVPTIAIQHGFISPESVEYMHTRTSLTCPEDGCPVPTRTAVGGTYTKELLTRLSAYPEESVVVTGHPRHDALVELKKHESEISKDEIFEGLGLNASKKTILIASGGFHGKYGWVREYDKDILKSMLNLASRRNDVQLIVRLHPMEDGRMQRSLIEERTEVRAGLVKGERNDLLWASDLFITVNSATAIDALVLGKQVLMSDPTEGIDIPTVDLGGAAIKCKVDDLGKHVEAAIDDPLGAGRTGRIVKAEVERHANTVDGHASARVARLLDEMARARIGRLDSSATRN